MHTELSIHEVATRLNVSESYVVGLLNDGHLPYHLVGYNRRVRV